MPSANSFSTSRRRSTAITQAAIVAQDSRVGNQPPTIETLPQFTVTARTVAPAAATAVVTAARSQRRMRKCGRRPGPEPA